MGERKDKTMKQIEIPGWAEKPVKILIKAGKIIYMLCIFVCIFGFFAGMMGRDVFLAVISGVGIISALEISSRVSILVTYNVKFSSKIISNAVRKQIPRSVEPFGITGLCPACHKVIETEGQKYCQDCGQKFKWEE